MGNNTHHFTESRLFFSNLHFKNTVALFWRKTLHILGLIALEIVLAILLTPTAHADSDTEDENTSSDADSEVSSDFQQSLLRGEYTGKKFPSEQSIMTVSLQIYTMN